MILGYYLFIVIKYHARNEILRYYKIIVTEMEFYRVPKN